ncbi:MAG: hypothetical protein NZL92_10680 [Gloeomargarita sp. SKYG116]|nr:hypothetical protein [Gloeomargarita sp. SKYG116]MCS7226444.1 hypothetical protein [Gloeomargarita sp. SKYB31]MDW8402147.1 hypothetical protein [Gloeomargarita sp. SKYGB_i_bin116]
MGYTFALAPMDRWMQVLTWGWVGMPLLLLVLAFVVPHGGGLFWLALLVLVVNGLTWCRWRPTAFVVHEDNRLEIRFPTRRRWIDLQPERQVRQVTPAELTQEVGWQWPFLGGFGWLWTQRRGWVEAYISRWDGLVLLQQPGRFPLLLTPSQPERFVELLQQRYC